MKDLATTGAGGLSAATLVGSVRWDAFPAPWGEVAKLGIALAVLVLGYLAYRGEEK